MIDSSDGQELLVHERELLALALRRYRQGDPVLSQAVNALAVDVARKMRSRPFTIVDKTKVPPSGDKHDYVSLGTYWWPNPDTPDGLPYVRRDGEQNPECADFDRPVLDDMVQAVHTLSLGWFFLRDTAYAVRAGELLRTFFLDAHTRMNPNLEFGQGIPGRCKGRGIGIIETAAFATTLIDAIGLLISSGSITDNDADGLRLWFSNYLDWLLQSAHGVDERSKTNNHGTAYDLQVAVFALFAGKEDTAREMLRAVPGHRIAAQIEPDGRQPRELTRTRALDYSTINLRLLFDLAAVAEKLGIDLWHFATEDGRGIRRALDWLMPFWTGAEPWTYQQIVPFAHERAHALLRRASWACREPAYEKAMADLPLSRDSASRVREGLFYPERPPLPGQPPVAS